MTTGDNEVNVNLQGSFFIPLVSPVLWRIKKTLTTKISHKSGIDPRVSQGLFQTSGYCCATEAVSTVARL